MPYPNLYNVTYSYTGFQQAQQGISAFPGTQLDADLAGLESAIDNVAAFVERAIRSDGQLTNGLVTYDSLSSALVTSGITPAEAWVTATAYLVNTPVVLNGSIYRANVAHTSGLFSTDLAAGKWRFVTKIPGSPGVLTVAAAGSNYFNADYVCDGVGDEVEINAAITLAASTGKEVKITAGLYSLNARIQMLSGVKLYGANKYGVTLQPSASFVTSSGVVQAEGISNFTISGLGIDGVTNAKGNVGISATPVVNSWNTTPCSKFEIYDNYVRLTHGHQYHIWVVRGTDFIVADNLIDGGYVSSELAASGTQEGIECWGTKRGIVTKNRISNIGNAGLNFPSFTDVAADSGFEDMLVVDNEIQGCSSGVISYLYSNSVTGGVGGMQRCVFARNVIKDFHVEGIDIEVLAVANFGGAVPIKDVSIIDNVCTGAPANQSASSRGLTFGNQKALSDISTAGIVIARNTVGNCLATAAFGSVVTFSNLSNFRVTHNVVHTPAVGSGGYAGVICTGSTDFIIDQNMIEGARQVAIGVTSAVGFSVSGNTCVNWNGNSGGFVGIQVDACIRGDVQGNRLKTTTFASVGSLVRFDATCDQINYLAPDNHYIGNDYAGAVVTLLGGLTFNAGVSSVTGPGASVDNTPAVYNGTLGNKIKTITYAAFKTLLSLGKADVGLGSVDNTSDAGKPVSTAQNAVNITKFGKIKTTVYTASNTHTLDANCLYVEAEGVGNGGGSGGATANGTSTAGGSGGAGGMYCRMNAITAAAYGAPKAVTIGAVGTAGTPSTAGGAGGDVSLGAVLVAKGGPGGTPAVIGSALPIATAAAAVGGGTGDVKVQGGAGFAGPYSSGAQVTVSSGNGGNSALGGGAPGVLASASAVAGVAGGDFGGGASGGEASGTASTAAGNTGGRGILIVREYLSS